MVCESAVIMKSSSVADRNALKAPVLDNNDDGVVVNLY